jgi:multicomponent Na+:H+ antiporter subunit D
MWLAAVALFVGLMTLFSMSKIWIEAFWRPSSRSRTTRPVPMAMVAAIGLLAAVTVALSVWPEPFIVYAHHAAQELADPRQYIAAVLGAPRSGGE